MSFWLRIDEKEKKKMSEPGHLSRESLENQGFRLTLGCEPMEYETFRYIIEDVLRNMGFGRGKFLTIGYEPIRKDDISAIQVRRSEFNGNMWVEIIKCFDDGIAFHTYCRNNVSTEKTIDIFEKVLVEYGCPNLSEWDEITDIIQKEQEYYSSK